MTKEKKYAILDTDFVSKTNIIEAAPGDTLANRVMEFPGYEFYCHDMMLEELGRRGTRAAQRWVQDNIESGLIHRYTDSDILDILSVEIGNHNISMYLLFLKISCDIYGKSYFEEKYASLIALSDETITKQQFLAELRKCDDNIGVQQSLGEKKAYVLLQALHFIKGDNVFLFCSDDLGARRGLADAAGIPCISVMAVFMKLKNMGLKKEETARYYESFVEWCHKHRQTQIYVWEFHGSKRRVKRDLHAIFDGLYRDEYILMLNGDLLIKE
ncbi:MAG: hypothetical protein SOW08_10745 [Lachnospiraceae bacterium]|nr:hypothetical protein [Lachnospiraceae bacterium]